MRALVADPTGHLRYLWTGASHSSPNCRYWELGLRPGLPRERMGVDEPHCPGGLALSGVAHRPARAAVVRVLHCVPLSVQRAPSLCARPSRGRTTWPGLHFRVLPRTLHLVALPTR